MDVNECIVKILEDVNVDHVFGGSGQVNASMLLALKDSKKIKTIIVRNEQAASFMACGYSMFSDRLGVCFATGGPGAFNLFSGMAVAYSDSLPILGITGYTSKSDRGKGALNESSGINRTPDSHKMFQATTKKSYIIEDPDDTCAILEDAINTAFNGRPGPVHIHVPKDITGATINKYRDIKIDIKPIVVDENKVKEIVLFLENALNTNRKIMALIGYGSIRSHAELEVLNFIESFQIPFASTMDAKGVISEAHPLSLGVYGTSGDKSAIDYFNSSDIIIAIGNSFAQNATFGFRKDLYKGKTLIHINIDPYEINKVYKADFSLVSDVKSAIISITDKLILKVKNISKKELTIDKFYNKKIESTGNKIHPAELVQILSQNLPENAIILGDAGSHMLWLNCYLNLTKNQRYQNPGSFGPMASHVNGAIGVKCANPEKTVICGCGDGAYLMAGFELLTAVQNNIPVIWIIFNNSEFNVIKKFLLNIYGKHAYMQFENPDYELYAKACKTIGFRVENIKDFKDIFNKALGMNKPIIIDVAVDGDVYPPFALGKV